jgi:class 3 adenylate cyclase/CHAT domain-containing protein/tetratricopeptide (TPR) repeat protein
MTTSNAGQESLDDLLSALAQIENKIERNRVERCVMFVDLCGYTAFVDRYGDVAGRRRIQIAGEVVAQAVEGHGGRIVKGLGDGWMLLFTSPQEAVQAAVEMQRCIRYCQQDLKEPIQLKIGLDYGRLLEDSQDIYGDVVNVSSRLVGLCQGDDILVSESVHGSIDPYYRERCESIAGLKVRGKSGTAVGYRLQWKPGEGKALKRDLSEKLKLEVLWSGAETRLSLSSSLEGDMTLFSYETHALNLDAIERTSNRILESIHLANLNGAVREASADLASLGQELFALLLPEEIQDRIRKTKAEYLVFHLDDACVHLPWELMHDGTEFLCCRFAIGRMVRTSQPARTGRRPNPVDSVQLLVICDPCGDLPAAAREGKELYHLCRYDSRVQMELLSGAATPDSLSGRLGDFDAIHYCGHAQHCPEQPDESGWILSGGNLTARGLLESVGGDRPGPLLVFNNACQSGATEAWKHLLHNESFGLVNAFLLAGCTHYIGALSDLLDLGSEDFARAFYRQILASYPVGKALRQARIESRSRPGSHSLTWAQYVLYGDPEVGIFSALKGAEEDRPLPPPAQPVAAAMGEHYRVIVSADMAHYSETISSLERRQGLGPTATHMVESQIREMFQRGCQHAGASFDQSLVEFLGDGAIFAFDRPEQADLFAEGVYEASAEWNRKAKSNEEYRCFRVGAFDGRVVLGEGGKLSGAAVTSAVRLEQTVGTGEILVGAGLHEKLTRAKQDLYGPEEKVKRKDHDEVLTAYRRRIIEPAPWEQPQLRGGSASIGTIGHRDETDVPPSAPTLTKPAGKPWFVIAVGVAACAALVLAASFWGLSGPTPSTGRDVAQDLWKLFREGHAVAASSQLQALRPQMDPSTSAIADSLLALESGKGEAAHNGLEKLLSESPGDPLATLALARAEWVNGTPDRAQSLLEELLAGKRAAAWHRAEAWRMLGQMAAAKGDTKKALECLAKTTEIDANDGLSWADRGILLEKDGNLEAAAAAFEKAASIAPEEVFIQSLLNSCKGRLERKQDQVAQANVREALDRLRERIKSMPEESHPDPWTSRPAGIALLDLKTAGLPAKWLAGDQLLLQAIQGQLSSTDRWFVVEREHLDVVLQELGIGSSELANSKYANRVGQLLAARFLLAGTVYNKPQHSQINLRLIDTETRRVAAVVERTVTGEWAMAASDLIPELTKRLERDYVLRGRIESASGTLILDIGMIHGVRAGQHFGVYPKELDPRAAGSVIGLKQIGEMEIQSVGEDKATFIPIHQEIPIEPGMRVEQVSTEKTPAKS